MVDVHPSWLCNDCIAEKRTDCALADPEHIGGARCWEPLLAGMDTSQPVPVELEPESDLVVVEHTRARECELCDGVCDFLEDTDLPYDAVLYEDDSSENRARRAEQQFLQDQVAERLTASLEGAREMPLEEARSFVFENINGVFREGYIGGEPPQFEVTYSIRDGETDRDALNRGFAYLRERLAAQQRLEDHALRLIDLTRIEGKTRDEVAEMLRARAAEPEEAKMDIAKAFGRGARVGAFATLAVALAWAAADRVWFRWR